MEIKRKKKGLVPSAAEGFTLLELLISVTIIAGLSLLIAQSFFTTTRSNTKTEILKDVKQNGDIGLGIMSNMIRASTQVATPCLAGGTTSSSLAIKNPDGGTTTFGCVFDSGVSRIASSSGAVDYLTSTNITLGGIACTDGAMSLQFTCTSLPSGGTTVKVNFSLSQKGTPVNLFERGQASFQTTINLRN